MTTITKTTFVKQLARDGGAIDTNNLSPELKSALSKAGGSAADLQKIAGQDGVIRGKADIAKLFAYVDDFDRNGTRSSIGTESRGKQTKSGQLYKALLGATDQSRASAGKRDCRGRAKAIAVPVWAGEFRVGHGTGRAGNRNRQAGSRRQ